MTDFRNLTQPHDLRSQLGLKDPVAIAQDLCRAINGEPSVLGDRITSLSADRVCKMSVLESVRLYPKPLNPADATPDPLHKTIAAMGCSSKTWAMRNTLSVNKLFSGTHPINVVVNDTPLVGKDASEIVASIRKMIDSSQSAVRSSLRSRRRLTQMPQPTAC